MELRMSAPLQLRVERCLDGISDVLGLIPQCWVLDRSGVLREGDAKLMPYHSFEN